MISLNHDVCSLIFTFLRQEDRRILSVTCRKLRKSAAFSSSIFGVLPSCFVDLSRFFRSAEGFEELKRFLPRSFTEEKGRMLLGAAIAGGDEEAVEFIKQKVSGWPDNLWKNSVKTVSVAAVELALELGAPVPLLVFYACTYGRVDILDLLYDWNERDTGRSLTLHVTEKEVNSAIISSQLEVLKWIDRRCDLHLPNDIFSVSPREGGMDLVMWLIEEKEASPSRDTLHMTARYGNLEVFSLIIDLVELRDEDSFGLFESAHRGRNLAIMKIAFSRFLTSRYPPILHLSGKEIFSVEMAEWIAELNRDPEISRGSTRDIDITDIERAAFAGDIELLEYYGMDPLFTRCEDILIKALTGKRPIPVFLWLLDHGFHFDLSTIGKLGGKEHPVSLSVLQWLILRYGNDIRSLELNEIHY